MIQLLNRRVSFSLFYVLEIFLFTIVLLATGSFWLAVIVNAVTIVIWNLKFQNAGRQTIEFEDGK